MTDSDLILFFNNVSNLTSFERKRKIYDLTNDLDIYLLYDLKCEFNNFYTLKLQEISRENRKTGNENHSFKFTESNEVPLYEEGELPVSEAIEFDMTSLNTVIDNFLECNDYNLIEEIVEKISDFIEDLDELIRRGKKLPKNLGFIKNINDGEIIDFSDTSITSKIIFLEKLGIVHFLRKQQPFNTSVNSMATAISAITGGKVSTIQSMLNPMMSKEVESKNNPMNSIKTVNVVENKLIQIGYKL